MNSIERYRLRRSGRLLQRVGRFDAEEEKTNEPKSGGHGNTRLPYGLAKGEGIDTRGMVPKEVWEALEGRGYSAKEEYKKLKTKSAESFEKVKDEVIKAHDEVTRIGEELRKKKSDLNFYKTLKDKKFSVTSPYSGAELQSVLQADEELKMINREYDKVYKDLMELNDLIYDRPSRGTPEREVAREDK